MADEEVVFKTYEEDPAQFNNWCYDQWEDYFQDFKPRNTENWQLYNNYSEDLVKRQKNKTLSRSCLFIPLLNSAINSRVAHKTQLITAVENLIKVFPKPGTSRETADNIEQFVNDLLKKAEFRSLVPRYALAQEIWPVCFVALSEDYEEGLELGLVEKFLRVYGVENIPLPAEKEWKQSQRKWKVKIDILLQHQVFYDVNASSWDNKQYAGTVSFLTLSELRDRIETHDYKFDEEKLKQEGQKVDVDEFGEELKTEIGAETKQQHDGIQRYRVLENWAIIPKPKDEDSKTEGTVLRKRITSTGKVKLRETDFPYTKLDIPLIPVSCYPNINQLEGISTADNGKHIQHAINDAFNIAYDSAKYGTFPPRLKDDRVTILNEEIITPGAEWDVNMGKLPGKPTDYIQPMFQPNPAGKDYFVLFDVLRGILEQIINAPGDVMQASPTDVEEKATKTKLRAAGASTRLMGNILSDVEVFKKMAFMIWAMGLESLEPEDKYQVELGYDENGDPIARTLTVQDLIGDVYFDVPHLAGLMDKEAKAAELLNFYALVAQEPFFDPRFPPTLKARYEMLKRIAEAKAIPDFDKILPPGIVEQLTQFMVPAMSQPAGGGEETRTPQRAGLQEVM